MFYILLILSIATIMYNYNKLIRNNKDIKTFAIISFMLVFAILYSFFLDDLRKYSLLKLFKMFSEVTMPWFIKFMKT